MRRSKDNLSDWLEDQLRELDPLQDPNGAYLWPQVQVSRQYSLHVLKLPGRQKVTWHKYLEDALDVAWHAGHEEITVILNRSRYTLRQQQA